MEELLFTEIYHSIVAAEDIVVEAIVLEEETKEREPDADDMEWSETEEGDPTLVPALSLPPPPSQSNRLTCPVCAKKMTRGKRSRLHLSLCAFYTDTAQRRRRTRRVKTRRTRRFTNFEDANDNSTPLGKKEFVVAGILAHSGENEFLVRWTERGLAMSWEPMRNFIDRDASGRIVNINRVFWAYAKTHRLACIESLI